MSFTEVNKFSLLPKEDLLFFLKELSLWKKTGILYFITDSNHWGEFKVLSGDIVSVRYTAKFGVDALNALSTVNSLRFSFEQLLDPSPIIDFLKEHSYFLPSTPHIFTLLGLPPIDFESKDPFPSLLKKTILILDDSALARKVLIRSLPKGKYEILEAEDGFQALSILGNTKVDLLFLDLILPGMDGYKVLSSIRKSPLYFSLPIIIVTSKDTLLDKIKGTFSSADSYLTKPYSFSELQLKVSSILDK